MFAWSITMNYNTYVCRLSSLKCLENFISLTYLQIFILLNKLISKSLWMRERQKEINSIVHFIKIIKTQSWMIHLKTTAWYTSTLVKYITNLSPTSLLIYLFIYWTTCHMWVCQAILADSLILPLSHKQYELETLKHFLSHLGCEPAPHRSKRSKSKHLHTSPSIHLIFHSNT